MLEGHFKHFQVNTTPENSSKYQKEICKLILCIVGGTSIARPPHREKKHNRQTDVPWELVSMYHVPIGSSCFFTWGFIMVHHIPSIHQPRPSKAIHAACSYFGPWANTPPSLRPPFVQLRKPKPLRSRGMACMGKPAKIASNDQTRRTSDTCVATRDEESLPSG